MAQLNGLPVFKIKVQESLESNTGIEFISLVDFPAIETNWVAFSNEKPLFFNKDKQLLAGPIMIPNQPIYRYSKDIGEYYVVFSVEEIENLVRKFQTTQKSINLNYQHQKNSQISKSVVQEIWTTGESDKSKDYGFDLPKGSAFVVAHIGDAEFWNKEVKTGNVKGFSIEGFLDMELKNIKKMSQEKFVSAQSKEGLIIQSDSEVFAAGVQVYTVDGEEKKPIPDATYTFDNGMSFKTVDSKITEFNETPEPSEDDITEEQMKAIEKVLAPILDKYKAEYDAKIAELEVKMSNITPAQSATEKTDPDKEKDKPNAYQTAMSAINKLKTQKNK